MSEKIVEILKNELLTIQKANPAYSLRAFAKRLKISPSSLSAILSGKRPLTKKNAERILRSLYASPEKIDSILRYCHGVEEPPSSEREIEAITKRIEAFMKAWNAHDCEKMSQFWTADGVLIAPWGQILEGRDSILAFYVQDHSTTLRNAQIAMTVTNVRFLRKNIALVDIDGSVTGSTRDSVIHLGVVRLHFAVTMEKVNSEWFVVASRPYILLPS